MQFLRGIFGNRKKEKPLAQTSPVTSSPSIADAFKEYINNEIPTHLIDTSKQRLVSREDVFRIFQDEIAKITEEQVQERTYNSQSGPLASYQPERETVLRQIIQEVVKYDVLLYRQDDIASEPTFWNFLARKSRVSKPKLKSKEVIQFCKTSRRLGRKLAWVDACCVDRKDTAEHSEATQAMYKWYANSYLCIVYLAESTSCGDWVHESWFTRGWTLQELLAPRRLKFYNNNWQPFNSIEIDDDRKDTDTVRRLESVTGISKAVLTSDNSHGIDGRYFWEIMTWVSKRETICIQDMINYLARLFHVDLTIAYEAEGQPDFSCLVKAIVEKHPSWHIFVWFRKPSADHFALPSSPGSYPRFEAHMAESRGGAQEFTITADGLSLKSLPLIPMELYSVVDLDGPGKSFCVTLKPRSDKESPFGRYGDLIVECGATRVQLIREARQLSACIINHHAAPSHKQGKLEVGTDYICFLLYSENGGDDENSWMRLCADNLLRISCVEMPGTTGSDMAIRKPDFTDKQSASSMGEPRSFTLPLVTTSIRSSTPK